MITLLGNGIKDFDNLVYHRMRLGKLLGSENLKLDELDCVGIKKIEAVNALVIGIEKLQ